jgi:hypothetical protein
MGERERIRKAIEGPVEYAEKLLAELQDADPDIRLAALINGWGRGLAAGLEELALAVEDLRTRPEREPSPVPGQAELRAPEPEGDHSEPPDLENASEGELRREAERSRDEIAAQREQGEEARRELDEGASSS